MAVGVLTVHVNFAPLMRFHQQVMYALEHPQSTSPIRSAFKQWAMRYRSFLSRRFDAYSKGGGDWKPLAKATLLARARRTVGRARAFGHPEDSKQMKAARRRYAKEKMVINLGGGKYSILRDTGILFKAIQPQFVNAPGQLELQVPGGIEVGYGATGIHPGTNLTIGRIASFHQTGGGRLPARKIIVPPDEATMKNMENDMNRAIKAIADEANRNAQT